MILTRSSSSMIHSSLRRSVTGGKEDETTLVLPPFERGWFSVVVQCWCSICAVVQFLLLLFCMYCSGSIRVVLSVSLSYLWCSFCCNSTLYWFLSLYLLSSRSIWYETIIPVSIEADNFSLRVVTMVGQSVLPLPVARFSIEHTGREPTPTYRERTNPPSSHSFTCETVPSSRLRTDWRGQTAD